MDLVKLTARFAVAVFILYALYLVIEPSLPQTNITIVEAVRAGTNVFRSLEPKLQRQIAWIAVILGIFALLALTNNDD